MKYSESKKLDIALRIFSFILILSSILFISCNSGSKKENEKSDLPTEQTTAGQDTLQKVKIQTSPQACKYSRSEQTDAFISDVQELQGYVWDDEEKTAQLVLNDHWGLTLKRGGCEHFELSAAFMYDRYLDLEQNDSMIFEQVKWITGLIDEFDSEQIADALDNRKIYIQAVGEGDYFINFTDEILYEYYQFRYRTWEDTTNFKIGKYIE